MSFHVENGLTAYCHFTTVPVCVPNVKTVLLFPVQTVAPPVTVPATVAESTVTVAGLEFASGQLPPMTARYWVVAVRSFAV